MCLGSGRCFRLAVSLLTRRLREVEFPVADADGSKAVRRVGAVIRVRENEGQLEAGVAVGTEKKGDCRVSHRLLAPQATSNTA